jgi:tetratricopeptide (TPR) repeat protein
MEQKAWMLCDTKTLRFWTWFYIADHRWALKAATNTSVAYYFPLGVFLRTMDQLNGEPSSLDQWSAIVDKVLPLAWAVSQGHLTVVKILICHLAVTVCIRNQYSTSRVFHQAVVACATRNLDSRRLNIVRLLIEGGAQTFDELFDAIDRSDRGALRVLVSFGDLVMPRRWPPVQQWLDTVLDCKLLKMPQSVSKENDQISTFLSRLRSRLIESRDALRMRGGGLSTRPISSGEPFQVRWSPSLLEGLNERGMTSPDISLSWKLTTPLDYNFSEQHQIAQILAKYGKYHEAIDLYESVLEGLKKKKWKHGSDFYLSTCCEKNMEGAINALRRKQQRAELNPELSKALNYHDVARMLAIQGKHMEAIPIYEMVLASLYTLHGDYNYEILTCLENLVISMGNLGYLAETKQLQGFVLKGYLLKYGGYHPLTAGSLRNLGVTLSREEKYPLAQSCFRWAAKVYTDTLGAKSPAAILCRNDWARAVENIALKFRCPLLL